jgi:hypothetical protein
VLCKLLLSLQVDTAVMMAEKSKMEEKVAKKEHTPKTTKDKKKSSSSKSNAMLTLHECGRTEDKVAYIVPTKEVPMEISLGYLISFDRMK